MTKDGGMLEGIPVIASQNVPTGLVIAINAPMILMADDGGVDFNVSTEACCKWTARRTHRQSQPRSRFRCGSKTWSASRAERFITWLKARAGSVQYISGVTIDAKFNENR